MSIDTQFRDIYRILEELQETHHQIESISKAILQCSRELRNIERIHLNRWRFYGPEVTEDPFELRDLLNKFKISCNTINYLNNPTGEFDDDIGDGCLFPSKRGWKKKQIKSLETDFADHERRLSLALSNVVYTTTLKIHRSSRSTDAALSLILRRAERRHALLERQDASARNVKQKSGELKIEDMDWELSLRRYFDCLETWIWEPEEIHTSPGSQPSSRTSSFTQVSYSRPPLQRTNSSTSVRTDSMRSNYTEYRRSDNVEGGQFFRQPRRRGSMSSVVGYTTANAATISRRNSLVGTYSQSSTALVLYNAPPPQPAQHSVHNSVMSRPRPIRRASISGDFHWEYVGKSSMFELLAPLTARWPELKDAQVDIYTQTEHMTSNEARAYASGRLASFPPEITNEVRRVLSMKDQTPISQELTRRTSHRSLVMTPPSPQSYGQPSPPIYASQPAAVVYNQPRSPSTYQHPQQYPTLSQVQTHFQPQLRQSRSSMRLKDDHARDDMELVVQNRRRSMSLDAQKRQTFPNAHLQQQPELSRNANDRIVPRLHSKPKGSAKNRTLEPRLLSKPQSPPTKPPATISNKRSFLGTIADMRPLSAISERPSTGKSRASSMEKSSSRSIMQAFMYKKSNLSQQMLETVADKPENGSGGRSSSGSDTLTSDRDLDPDFEKRSSTTTITKPTTPKGVINTHKPLPPRPKNRSTPKLISIFKSHMKKDKPTSRASLPPTLPTYNRSQETVKRMSVELLKRRDSRITLLSMGDGMDVPFDMWLRALPYIEGRCSTPNIKL